MLNKVDAIDPACAEDLSNIYSSNKIATMCAEASAACGVPVNNVFPMKSYSSEYNTDYRVRDWRHETLCFLSLGPLKRAAEETSDACRYTPHRSTLQRLSSCARF